VTPGTALALLALAAAAVVLTLWRARRRARVAEAAFPPEGRIMTVDGTRVHCLIRGSGPDLVLIHGASGNLRDMSFALIDRLARDYRVIAFDRPGLGHSARLGRRGASIGGQAALLRRAAAKLGVTRPVVMGQSYGGAVALAWAVDAPESLAALVLVSAPAYPWPGGLPWLYKITAHPLLGPLAVPALAAWVPEAYLDRAVAGVFAPQAEPPGYARHIGAALTLRAATLRENALQRASLKAELAALSQRYDRLRMPVEILHGGADATVGLAIHSEPLARALPAAHLQILDGIGHMPHHSRPGAVVEAIHRAARRAGLWGAQGAAVQSAKGDTARRA
jgi:pimeloyl-ACP methyl ester carboxylesterase